MIKTIITFIIVFGILVVIHEFGHYYFAKRAGILVREFSIGMGPKLLSFHRGSTTYTLRILPLGGYVRMAGIADDEDEDLKPGMPMSLILDEHNKVIKINTSKKTTLYNGIPIEYLDSDLQKDLWISGYENGNEDEIKKYDVDHDALIIEKDGTEIQIAPEDVQFQSATLWNRILTNFAGPMNNFLLAIVAFILLAFMQGGVATNLNQIGTVQENSVAQKAGLKPDDKIVSVAGKKTTNWTELTTAISAQPNKKIALEVVRNDKTQKIMITPEASKNDSTKTGKIGITVKLNRSFVNKITYGFTQSWAVISSIIAVLIGMFTKGVSLNDFGGPVAIYAVTSNAASYGLTSVISLLAFLSINLGIVNLLPIPALDGGKLVLNIIEGIRGKPISPEKEGMITLIGFAFLMILMILVTWNDIQRYFF
ncbi:zinc metalloprotease [Dellaglioa algida]|nr:zinc metalloprotease [Dellaglioa algida]